MAASAVQVLYVLEKIATIKDKAKVIKVVKVNDVPVKSFKFMRFDLSLGEMYFEMTYVDADGKENKLSARHVFRSDVRDVIKVNGKDVEDDKIEFDIDVHLLRADAEYRLSYTENGEVGEVFMLASVNWFNLGG